MSTATIFSCNLLRRFDFSRLPKGATCSIGLLLFLLLVFAVPVQAQQNSFTVTVASKTSDHPYNGQGWSEGFVIDGDQGKELTLQRGVTYTFEMNNVAAMHSFYISTSAVGGGAGVYSDGVSGNFANGNETLTFTPGADTPDQLYYQCNTGGHTYMGWKINVVDAAPTADVSLDTVATGLTSPVTLVEPPDGSGRLFIVDQIGLVRIVSPGGTLREEPFLDLREEMIALRPGYDERGLLGLAFHPDYATNGRFFVYYSAPLRAEAPDDYDHTSHISEFAVASDNPNRADADSEQILLQIDQPQSNHNGGTLAFGPDDGHLYISLGDGGGANDVGLGHVEDWYSENGGGNGQNVTENLLGSILRVTVDDAPYGIPSDNPFVGTEGRDEIYAYGFRNPYRFSFDMANEHRLFVGDAGQNLWEEVSVVALGGNYGWNVKEGTHCFDAENPEQVPADCPNVVGTGHPDAGAPLLDPVIEFRNTGAPDGGLGVTVVGGHVYRGADVPMLDGRYIFGVWSASFTSPSGQIFVADEQPDSLWAIDALTTASNEEGHLGRYLLGFGQDRSGEVYALTTDSTGPSGTSGMVFRLAPAEGSVAAEDEATLPSSVTLTNRPNPFAGSTTLRFSLPHTQDVRLVVYDVLGRQVATLLDGRQAAGAHSIRFDASDYPSGVYFGHLMTEHATVTRSLLVVR